MSGPTDRPAPDIGSPPALDFDAQRMRASLRAKMFGIEDGPLQIGRFTVLGLVGRGGTGIVYAARDIRLDRTVAVKVLSAGHHDMREAEVLATLSHPNVVQIYEVGRFRDRLFLAMELVDGTTVEQWLAAAPRHWREIVECYAQAGRGLAAAHRKGIVHRDVKPANLLVGHDGRVRVVDFGLARAVQRDPASEIESTRAIEAAVELELTQTADIMGTPAYMAPEQIARQQTDARTDQFSFCVSLWEALFGARPHAGRTSEEVLRAILEGRCPRAPHGRGVPRRIRRALERGLSRSPEDRFPGMEALLAELQPRAAGHRLLAAAFGATAIVVAAAWIGSKPPSCDDGSAALAEAWDDGRGAAVVDAFAGTPVAGATDTAHEVRRRLDAYADAWLEARRLACTRDPTLLDRRMACLDRRRRSLAALARRLADADEDVVHHAVEATDELPRIEPCNDDDALRSSIPPEQRADVAAVRALVDEARTQSSLGHYRDAAAQAEIAVERAQAIDHPPALAEAMLELGRAHARLDHAEPARTALLEAGELAEASRHDEVAADAWIELVYVEGALADDRDAALHAYRRADAAVLRLGDDPIRRGELLRDLGLAHYFADDLERARPAFEEALALQRRALGDDHLAVARTLGNYADALAWAGRVDEALLKLEEARIALEHGVGARHPRVGMILFVRGLALQSIGRFDEARSDLDAALEIYGAAFGRRSAKVASALEAVAKLELERGRFAAGLEPAQEALQIRDALVPAGARDRLVALVLLGELEHAVGRPDAATKRYEEALSLLDDDPADAEQRALLQTNLALALHEARRPDEAVNAFERALASFAAPELAHHPARQQAVDGLARAQIDAGRHLVR